MAKKGTCPDCRREKYLDCPVNQGGEKILICQSCYDRGSYK